jgi:hypothetical protein
MPYLQRPSTLDSVSVQSEVVSVAVQPYTGQGYLEVHVYFRGVEVTATVTIVNPVTGETIATYTSPQDFPMLTPTGTYILYAYYEEYRASQTVEIKEGQTTIWRVYMEPKRVCFVATACYGYGHPALETFRWFRNKILLTNILGIFFTKAYYYYIGYPIAKTLRKHNVLRNLTRRSLDLALQTLRSLKNIIK